jgi:serine/threonine protein kinase
MGVTTNAYCWPGYPTLNRAEAVRNRLKAQVISKLRERNQMGEQMLQVSQFLAGGICVGPTLAANHISVIQLGGEIVREGEEAEESWSNVFCPELVIKRLVNPHQYQFLVEREGAILRQLQRSGSNHPSIVRLINQRDNYLVLEYIRGLPLGRLQLDLPALLFVTLQMTCALEYVHNSGIIHCDVKPFNIMFSIDGRVILIDFALARSDFLPELGEAGIVWGTPFYSAPEIIAQGTRFATPASDLYSLGVSILDLFPEKVLLCRDIFVNGRITNVPFPGRGPVLDQQQLKKIPAHLRSLATGLLERDPDKRLTDQRRIQGMLLESLNEETKLLKAA